MVVFSLFESQVCFLGVLYCFMVVFYELFKAFLRFCLNGFFLSPGPPTSLGLLGICYFFLGFFGKSLLTGMSQILVDWDELSLCFRASLIVQQPHELLVAQKFMMLMTDT